MPKGWNRMFSRIKNLIRSWRDRRKLRKRIAEMRKRDPFIYK